MCVVNLCDQKRRSKSYCKPLSISFLRSIPTSPCQPQSTRGFSEDGLLSQLGSWSSYSKKPRDASFSVKLHPVPSASTQTANIIFVTPSSVNSLTNCHTCIHSRFLLAHKNVKMSPSSVQGGCTDNSCVCSYVQFVPVQINIARKQTGDKSRRCSKCNRYFKGPGHACLKYISHFLHLWGQSH